MINTAKENKDLAAVMVIWILTIPLLLGEEALRLLFGKQWKEKRLWSDSVLTGWIIVIGLAETAHLGVVVSGRSFSDFVKWFFVSTGVCAFLAAVFLVGFCRRRRDRAFAGRPACRLSVRQRVIFGILGFLALVQILTVLDAGRIYLAGDMTVETVNTMLATDTVYQINPMTGNAYVQGMPFRLKILCLPSLYGAFCRAANVEAIQLVWTAVPVAVLLLCYLAYGTVARALFPENAEKRGIFLICVLFILWICDSMYGLDGFGVQFAGFRGLSIRGAVLIPWTFGLILRRKWRLVPLCILAEACMVWTFYGMGACFFIAAGMLFLKLVKEGIESIRQGRGDERCGN